MTTTLNNLRSWWKGDLLDLILLKTNKKILQKEGHKIVSKGKNFIINNFEEKLFKI